MKKFEVENHEPSYLPDGEWKLAWNDEFDGTDLDMNKWDYRLNMMGQKWPAWTDDNEAIKLDGKSNAVFSLIKKDGIPVSAQLQTGYNYMDQPVEKTKFGADALQWNIGKLHENKYTHRYGYYECRCKLQQKNGWWSAFWIQSPMIGASLNASDSGAELDIMECFEPGDIAPHNAFKGGYGLDCKNTNVGGKKGLNKDEYHYFGMLWDERGYTFYIDGVEDGHISEYVSNIPEFILISTEVKGYRYDDHKPIPEAFEAIGDKFYVDHIRVFDKIRDDINENNK